MRYIIFILLMSCGILSAQTSIGIRQPENTKNVTAYRIPDWRYSVLSANIRGGFAGSFLDKTDDYDQSNTLRSNWDVDGYWDYFQESEKQVVMIDAGLRTDFNYDYDVIEPKFGLEKITKQRNANIAFSLGADWQYYTYKKSFIDVSAQVYTYNNWDKKESEESWEPKILVDSNRKNKDREFDIRLGYGVGRVRNVTPVIRALRMRERLDALDYDIELGDKDIDELAHHMAKYAGYTRVYDRYDKYFWQDFADLIGIEYLKPYEMFYLQDALDEQIGERYEGWSIAAGVNVMNKWRESEQNTNTDHVYVQTDTEPGPDRESWDSSNSSESKERYWGPYLSAQWSKNITLRHQVRLHANVLYRYMLENSYKWKTVRDGSEISNQACDRFMDRFNYELSAEYLWVLHDRLLWINSLDARFHDYQYDVDGYEPIVRDDVQPKARGNFQDYNFESSFRFYIENNLVITSTFRFRRHELNSTAQTCVTSNVSEYYSRENGLWSWSYAIGLSYYLDRKMF